MESPSFLNDRRKTTLISPIRITNFLVCLRDKLPFSNFAPKQLLSLHTLYPFLPMHFFLKLFYQDSFLSPFLIFQDMTYITTFLGDQIKKFFFKFSMVQNISIKIQSYFLPCFRRVHKVFVIIGLGKCFVLVVGKGKAGYWWQHKWQSWGGRLLRGL